MDAPCQQNPAHRVAPLHALACLERLSCLEKVEETHDADAAAYAGRRLHEELKADEGEAVGLILEDKGLGVLGSVDCVRHRDGRLIPYEDQRDPGDRLSDAARRRALRRHVVDLQYRAGEDLSDALRVAGPP